MEAKKKFDKIAYNNDFNKRKYDRLYVLVEKGEKDRLKTHAESNGESLNEFIKRAISEQLKRDSE